MNTSTSVSVEKKTETEILNFLTHYAVVNDYSLALWQPPHSSVKHLILSQQYKKLQKDTALESLNTGFIFSPFDKDKESIYLHADFLFSFENGSLKQAETPQEIASTTWLRSTFEKTSTLKARNLKSTTTPPATGNASDYILLVERCLREIEKGIVEKVVPSRIRQITIPDDFDVLEAFQKLCQQYTNALISFVAIPGAGNWLGATPEVLVGIEDKTIFRTVALAGTQPYHEGINLKAVAWTQKEIEEQALVERYIISCFKKIRVREYEEHGPKTVVAGNLMHLKSDFTINMKAINFTQLGTVMLQLLHPTSAVCGMPLEPSVKFLKDHEGYDRAYYSGFLGPVNVNNNTTIFVNIRCMQLWQNNAILYAGAGVTIDSEPVREYEETEMKFNTLLNVIF
jgi:isochorismate synthase